MKTRNYRTAVLSFCLVGLGSRVEAQSTIDATNKYAYGANTGWINFLPSPTQGVVVGEAYLSGFAYGANFGWMNFGDGSPGNGHTYGNASDTDFGVNHNGAGQLSGRAYGANIGWINFEANGNPRVNRTTGKLQGHAWGANVGWIVLDDMGTNYVATTQLVMGADTDTDGISDAWEYEQASVLFFFTAVSDYDKDGILDIDEYRADTDPFDNNSNLKVVSLSINAGSTLATIGWSSKSTRRYFIESRTAMESGTWLDVGVGALPGSAGSMSLMFAQPASTKCFYRVRAQRFLP